MDCYYALVEMKKHNIPAHEPVAVLQWRTIIALNYVAKGAGVKRQMISTEALTVCPNLKFVHVSTIGIDEEGRETLYPSSLVSVTTLESKRGDENGMSYYKVHSRD